MSEPTLEEAKELFIPFLEKDWIEIFRYFLVQEKMQIVGGCGLAFRQMIPSRYCPTGRNGYIWNMYVERSHRKRGIGGKLVKHVLDYCKKEGIFLVELHTSGMGKSVYEKQGFLPLENYLALFLFKPSEKRRIANRE